MALVTITNRSRGARILPVGKEMIEIPPNGTADIEEAEWDKLRVRKSVRHDLDQKLLLAEKAAKAADPKKEDGKEADKKTDKKG